MPEELIKFFRNEIDIPKLRRRGLAFGGVRGCGKTLGVSYVYMLNPNNDPFNFFPIIYNIAKLDAEEIKTKKWTLINKR